MHIVLVFIHYIFGSHECELLKDFTVDSRRASAARPPLPAARRTRKRPTNSVTQLCAGARRDARAMSAYRTGQLDDSARIIEAASPKLMSVG